MSFVCRVGENAEQREQLRLYNEENANGELATGEVTPPADIAADAPLTGAAAANGEAGRSTRYITHTHNVSLCNISKILIKLFSEVSRLFHSRTPGKVHFPIFPVIISSCWSYSFSQPSLKVTSILLWHGGSISH